MAYHDCATHKQLRYIANLRAELGREPKDFTGISRRQAETLINDLLESIEVMSEMAERNGV